MFKSVFGKKLILPLLLLLGACGGGTSTSVPTSAPVPPGISSTGRVTGFGSVYVNGVKFNTSSTTKISNDDVDDGEVITENDLKVGDVVEVKGTSDDAANANAQSIEMASEVKGPVDNVFNAATKTLVVMGQTILINNNTAIDNNIGPNGLGDLKVGDLVEVHGFRDGTGNIVATRIERQGAVAKFRVRGNISALNGAAKTFKIGNLTVDYSAAQVVPTSAVLADGMRGLGFDLLLPEKLQAPIIYTFHMPTDPKFVFQRFYDDLKDRGYVIYPGKLTVANSVRVGCIGRINADDMRGFLKVVAEVLAEMGVTNLARAA